MVDYNSLLNAKPDDWKNLGGDWRQLSQHCVNSSTDIYGQMNRLAAAWPGNRAVLDAIEQMKGVADAYQDAGDNCMTVATTLEDLTTGASRAQYDLNKAVEFAKGVPGLTINPNGGNTPVSGPRSKEVDIGWANDHISNALAEASGADTAASGTLNTCTERVGSPLPDPGEHPGTPPDDHIQIDPSLVRRAGGNLDGIAESAQKTTRSLLSRSESGMYGGTRPGIGPINDNAGWESLVKLGFCALRHRQHLDNTLLNRLSSMGTKLAMVANNSDAAAQAVADTLKVVFDDMAKPR